MADNTFVVNMKVVGDISDARSNIESLQKSFGKLKLPDKISGNLNKKITEFYKEYEKYQKKISEGVKTQGDYNQVEKSLNRMRGLYQEIGKEAGKVTKLDLSELIDMDSGNFKQIANDIKNTLESINKVKVDPKKLTSAFDQIKNVTKNTKITGENGILGQLIGHLETGEIEQAKKKLQELQAYAQKVRTRETADGKHAPGTLSADNYSALTSALQTITFAFDKAEAEADPFIQKLKELQTQLEKDKAAASKDILGNADQFKAQEKNVDSVTESLKRMHEEEFSFNRQAQDIDRQIQSYFGLSQMIRKVGDIAKDAFATVKELDQAMTQTAVVTNFSVGDMWDMLPTYTAQANQLGSTIRDVYEAATLYYQQGLNTNQAMGLANETLKMARIAGLGAAEATDMMTAALRGFNMEINQQSAQKINDIYSELAAITASDTAEIGSAMERTASIANSANMEFATTSAFLAQMIETTREAPENLGTAMKTIVARFQEMKQDPTKLIDSEGVAMDANKVDKALKTIGVNLMNTKGEFRDLDDVFLDISAKWDSLTQGQQRYIATIAAGSRQQSRFIAMMSNYERTMELVDAANNSAGASQRQFEKTLDSMEAKLNQLKNAWDQFTMGLMNNQILKFGVDRLTDAFTIVNKLIDLLGGHLPDPFGGITKSVLTLVTTLGMLNFGKKASRGLIMGGAGWWKGETSLAGGFAQGWKSSGRSGLFKNRKSTAEAEQQGTIDGQAYGKGWAKAVQVAQSKHRAENLGVSQIELNQIQALPVGSIIEHLLPKDAITAEAAKQLQECIDAAGGQVHQGLVDYKHITGKGKLLDINQGKQLQSVYDNNKIKTIETNFSSLTGTISSAGSALMNFGMILQGTPLEPFGQILTTVGSSLMSLTTALTAAKTGFLQQWAAAYQASIAHDAQAVSAFKAAIAEEGLSIATLKSAGAMSILRTAIWTTLWPLLAVAAAIGAVVLIAKGLDAAIETNKEQLEAASDAAAAASEAYDSAKQETSELTDAISKIQETDSAFDGLIAGTAEFNEQLVTANEQILALIDKYPMLMESGYVSTDKNGLMHISDEGFKAVKEYQKQIQANASAMNLIQTADLNALENQQKADALRKKINGSRRGEMTESEAEEHKKNLRDADLLEQRAKAEVELARSNAIRTALSGKELRDTEALTAVYSSLYDEKRKIAEIDVAGLSAHDIRQKYADYHGYTYEKSTKKIKDIEGNEIDYDDKAIKDEVIEQTVLLDFEANASSLEGILNKLDNTFNKTLDETFKDSSHFLTDILSSNIETNTDLLEQVLDNPKELQDVIDSLSTKEVEAILGLTTGTVDNTNFDKYKNDVVDLFLDKASNIIDTQSQSYGQLAAMLAQSKGWTTSETTNIIGNKEMIQSMLKQLTVQQANTLSAIGQTLNESIGSEAMSTFIRDASDIYLRKSQDTINEFDNIISDINWESAASRLEGYHKAIDSTDVSIQKWGKDMRASADEANILGDAFDEFLGGDWAELSENVDDFKNAMGQIDGAGILKASEQSKTLKSLLDSGEVSATGLAMALQGIEDGKYSIGAVDTTVLQLLSSLNRLADAAYEAHNIIEKFDAGIDTGEGEDFVKDNAEKAREYYNNGEFGNQQLQNYIKLAAGEERWNAAIRERHGDLQLAEKDLMSYVDTFKDGFQPAWDQMVAGKGINGQSLVKNITEAVDSQKISKELGDKFKDVKTYWDDEGYLTVDFGELSTAELEKYYEAAYDVSEEYAKLLVQDLANYDATVSSMLAKNDLKEAVQSESFQREHMVDGKMILTDAQLKAFEDAGGSLEDLARAAGTTAEELTKNQFHVLDENGNRIDNTNNPQLLYDYIKAFNKAEKGSIQSLFETGSKELFTNNKLDLNKLVKDTQSKGFDQNQAMQAAWQAYQRGEQLGKRTTVGETELKQGIKNYEEFVNEMNSTLETDKWVTIGEAIAQGAMNFFNKQEQKEQEINPLNRPDKRDQPWVSKPSIEKDSSKLTTSEAEKAATEASRRGAQRAAEDTAKFWKALFTPSSDQSRWKEEQGIGTQSSKISSSQTKRTEQTSENLNKGASQLEQNTTSLSHAAEALNQAAGNLNQAATALSNKQGNTTESSSQTKVSQENIKGIENAGRVVQEVAFKTINKEETEQAIQTVKTEANEGAQLNVKATADSSIQNTLKAVQGLKKAATSKTTANVGANVKGTEGVKSLSSASKDLKSKTIQITAKVNGLQQVKNLHTEIKNLPTSKTTTITTVKETIHRTKNEPSRYGLSNKIITSHIPQVGSLAGGTKKGRIGPKNKGGITLTGEEGYEIAWLPSEGQSLILGVNGPQMIDLPNDAVVWNHTQSEDIMKRKGIVYGSMGGARTGRQKSTSSVSSKNKKSSNKNKNGKGDKNKNKKTEKETKKLFEKVNVWWDNFSRRAEARQRAVDKATKSFEKSLKGITGTSKNAQAELKKYQDALNASIKENTDGYNHAIKQLQNLDNGVGDDANALISYSYTKKNKKGKKEEKTKQEWVNLGEYVKFENGAYQVDQSKLDTIANLEKRKAIADAANQKINDWVGKANNAQDAIEKAQEELEKAADTMYETFDAWEKSINEIYVLSKQLELLSGLKDFSEGVIELQSSMLRTGYQSIEQGRIAILQALNDTSNQLQGQIDASNLMLTYQQKKLEEVLNIDTYYDKYAKNPNSAEAKDQFDAAKEALALYSTFGGDIEKITAEALRKFNDQEYNESFYNKVKQVLDDIATAQTDVIKTAQDSNGLVQEIFGMLEEANTFIIDFKNSMLEGLQEQTENEINKLDKLNNSLTKSLKSLLDDIKRKIDERRQQEDNSKTESDISKKQQRLAALQADTSGGHQVEIAQLQQEIAEAQQSYQRGLEDQLLEKLQNQADQAAEQRERQIELLQAQRDIADASGITMKEIENLLLQAREGSEEEKQQAEKALREIYRNSQHYYDKDISEEDKTRIDNEFDEKFAMYGAYMELLPQLKNYASQNTNNATITTAAVQTATTTPVIVETEKSSVPVVPTPAPAPAPKPASAPQPAPAPAPAKPKPGQYNKYGAVTKDTNDKTPNGSKKTKAVQYALNQLMGAGLKVDGNFGSKTIAAVKKFQKKYGLTQDGKVGPKTAAKFNSMGYKTGGLADYTGPAWLDGTPSKPELVLNSTDTKNFIALKDVLSKAMGSTNAIENTYGGDTTFEININVDHLNNDYDVDKVAERVKKIIVKDSSYRNVTQVRNFR